MEMVMVMVSGYFNVLMMHGPEIKLVMVMVMEMVMRIRYSIQGFSCIISTSVWTQIVTVNSSRS